MKIVLVGSTYPYRGGIAHYSTLLCRELRKEHDVKFISWKRQYPRLLFPGKTDKDNSRNPVKIDNVDYLIDSLNPITWIQAAKEIVKYKPDLLLFNWWVAFWYPQFSFIVDRVKAKLSSKLVVICHNAQEHEKNRIKAWASKSFLSRADRIITHSKEQNIAVKKMVGQSADVVTGFHPTYADLSDKRYSKEEAKKNLNLKGNVLLFFGFVRRYKGLHVLLEALSLMKDTPNTTLLIVGEFWKDKKEYLTQINKLNLSNNVIIIDKYVPNEQIGLYFAAADLVVQPYLSVTGSGICQTAYGFDRPVVATNLGSLSEIIEQDINGKLVEPNNPKSLAIAISKSLEPNVLEKLTKNAATIKENFSWKSFSSIVTSRN